MLKLNRVGVLTRSRPSVLLVEDNAIIALDMASVLEGLGCEVIGPAGNLDKAMSLADSETLDAAVLDINLGETRSWPVAHKLADAGIPLVLASGYSRIEVDSRFEGAPLLAKPVQERDLKRALERIGLLQTSG